MTTFRIIAKKEFDSDESYLFFYDNITGEMSDVEPSKQVANWDNRPIVFGKDGLRKNRKIRKLKIQLGLSCNYECGYCSQRFVERPEETSLKHVEGFLEKLNGLDLSGLEKVEFWGGEPFVYWKTLKPLAEAMRAKYPAAIFGVVTNGSLLDEEKVEWMDKMNFGFAISHDGPAQHFRGPDPLDDPETKRFWRYLWWRFGKHGRMTFNAMMHGKGATRAEVYKFFTELTGDPEVRIGEGGLIDAYDADGLAMSLHSKADHFKFRQQAFKDWIENPRMYVSNLHDRVQNFMDFVHNGKDASFIGQKCGMDDPDIMAVDLVGNVITCQNVSAAAVAMNGQPHVGGTIDAIEDVRLKAVTHWRDRPHCAECPVLAICQGNCMYLEGENWATSCDNQYSDAVTTFAIAFFSMHQMIPILIEPVDSELPLHRRDIWGTVYEHAESQKRVIPILEAK